MSHGAENVLKKAQKYLDDHSDGMKGEGDAQKLIQFFIINLATLKNPPKY